MAVAWPHPLDRFVSAPWRGVVRGTRRRRPVTKPFAPFVSQGPPPGLYDPSLDISLAAAKRGYGDLQQDVATQQTRGTSDYLTQVGQIQRQQGWAGEDVSTQRQGLEQGYGRSLADLLTGNARESENYGTSVANLNRAYEIKGGQQRQAQAAAGVSRGGAVLQALAKRTANQALDRAPIDTGHARYLADAALQQTRLGEDRGAALASLERGAGRQQIVTQDQLDQLKLLSAPATADNPLGGRANQDLVTQLQRAGREAGQYGIDIGTVKNAQAAQAGWLPAQRAKNEFVGPDGKPYRVVIHGDYAVGVDPSGRELWRRRRR